MTAPYCSAKDGRPERPIPQHFSLIKGPPVALDDAGAGLVLLTHDPVEVPPGDVDLSVFRVCDNGLFAGRRPEPAFGELRKAFAGSFQPGGDEY